jgi:hypothetical protein
LCLFAFVNARVVAAGNWDYLVAGERERDSYDTAIRKILSKGWGKDVVLRYVHIPPFESELVIGIRRAGRNYHAFVIEPSSHIWDEEVKRLGRKHPDFSRIRAVYKERPISEAYVRRVAAVWRNVLADSRNYHNDEAVQVDSSQLYFLLSLRPGEHSAAHATALGPKTEELMHIASDLSAFVYPAKADERMMFTWLDQSEKKMGIKIPTRPNQSH